MSLCQSSKALKVLEIQLHWMRSRSSRSFVVCCVLVDGTCIGAQIQV